MLKRNTVVGRIVTMSLIAAVPLIFAITTAGPSNGLPAGAAPAVPDVNEASVAAMPAANAVGPVDLAAEVTRAVTSALDTAKQRLGEQAVRPAADSAAVKQVETGPGQRVNFQDGRTMVGDAFAGAHDRLTQGCSQMGGFLDETQTQLTDALGNAERQFGEALPGSAGTS